MDFVKYINNSPPFQPILSALYIPTYNFAKLLVPTLKLKDHFNLLKRFVSKTLHYLWVIWTYILEEAIDISMN